MITPSEHRTKRPSPKIPYFAVDSRMRVYVGGHFRDTGEMMSAERLLYLLEHDPDIRAYTKVSSGSASTITPFEKGAHMPSQEKHDFRGITTQSRVEPARTPTPVGRWQTIKQAGGLVLIYHPASEASQFNLRVTVNDDGWCVLDLYPKDVTPAASPILMESRFRVDGDPNSSPDVLLVLQHKARQLAQKLLKRQAALL